MRKYFKYLIYLFVFIGYSLSNAGSYDDFFRAIDTDNDHEVQRLLMRGFDPNTPNEKGSPGLMVAIQAPAPKIALLLAKHPNTKIEFTNTFGETPLMLAAINNHLEVAAVLIARGADVNRPGWTPLHYAAAKGHKEMMRLLLEHDAYIDSEAENGTTPLMLAALSSSPLAVKLLLEEGADPTLVNSAHASALNMALLKDHQQAAFYIRAFTEAWFIQNPVKDDE